MIPNHTEMKELVKVVVDRLSSGFFLPVHNCSMCNYLCGFLVTGKKLMYDAGCICKYEGRKPREIEDLVKYVIDNSEYVQQWLGRACKREEMAPWLH